MLRSLSGAGKASSNAQIVALQSFFKVYEALHGYEFGAPEKYEIEKGVKLISREPEYNTSGYFGPLVLTDKATFVFEYMGVEYCITIGTGAEVSAR
jgi:hypothetical protein